MSNCDILPYHECATSKISNAWTGGIYRIKLLEPERVLQYKKRLEKHRLQVAIA